MPSIDVLLYVSLNKLLKQTSPAAGDLKRQDAYVTSLQSRNIPQTGKKTKAGADLNISSMNNNNLTGDAV